MKYMVDIDNTICYNKNSNYEQSQPDIERIAKLNKLFDEGHEIHYWTARGAISGKNWDEFTVNQLNDWGVKYTSINMGKPHYDVWIDDKALNAEDVCISKLLVDHKAVEKYDGCVLNSQDECE